MLLLCVQSIGNISICTPDRLNCTSTKAASYNVFLVLLSIRENEVQKPSGIYMNKLILGEKIKCKIKLQLYSLEKVVFFKCHLFGRLRGYTVR